MKVVILAGGRGTRISEESVIRPKPMVEIGGKPILWHIMKSYEQYGFNDFVVCCGYKGQMIKQYFVNYYLYQTDSTFSLDSQYVHYHKSKAEPWRVTLANTGLNTLTAGRILKIKEYVGDEPFMLTYGDGVADVDINKLIEFHNKNKKIVTITTTQPAGRFGGVQIEDGSNKVLRFKEKERTDQAWVNMGFMVCEPEIFDYLGDGSEMLEAGPFEALAKAGQMDTYRHDGFWSPMDNIHDREYLEKLWATGVAPWKTW